MGNNKTGFKMKGYNDFFKPTDPDINSKNDPIDYIDTEKLVPFKNHPFKLYEGERFADMIQSVKSNGIIMPIIVRALTGETFEILSGHNRVEAAKSIGLTKVPAIIRKDLTDDEALLIVTETNLRQRGFEVLSHSEKAAVLSVHHGAIKNQGRRTDLINEIDNLFINTENISNNAENTSSAHIVPKSEARDKTAKSYDLNRGTVTRYIRIYNNLDKLFNALLDSGTLPFIAAVELSYMSNADQINLYYLIQLLNLKIDIKKAKLLRKYSEEKKLTKNIIKDILSGTITEKKKKSAPSVQSLKIKGEILSKYFKPEQKPEQIQKEIIRALEFYRANKK